MSDRSSNNSRFVKNPLLSGAGSGFPFEDFSSSAVLFPVSESSAPLISQPGEIIYKYFEVMFRCKG